MRHRAKGTRTGNRGQLKPKSAQCKMQANPRQPSECLPEPSTFLLMTWEVTLSCAGSVSVATRTHLQVKRTGPYTGLGAQEAAICPLVLLGNDPHP